MVWRSTQSAFIGHDGRNGTEYGTSKTCKNTTKDAITLHSNDYKLRQKQKPVQRKTAKFHCLRFPDNKIVSLASIGESLYLVCRLFVDRLCSTGAADEREPVFEVCTHVRWYVMWVYRNDRRSSTTVFPELLVVGFRRTSTNERHITKRPLVRGREFVYNERRVNPCSIFLSGH